MRVNDEEQEKNAEMEWLGGIVGVVLATLIATWLLGFLNRFAPSPGRSSLAVANLLRAKSQRSEDRFRFVLCWLENDSKGDDTSVVAQAFSSVPGVTLVRSARIVKASGAADDWRPAMQTTARAVLERWSADLAVVGLVKKPGEALSLWFVLRSGDGTLSRGDQPYELDRSTLGLDFHDDLRAQLTAMALATVAPLTDTEVRGKILEEGLKEVTEKLAILLERPAIQEPERRAPLLAALGNSLATLGERESGAERLKKAVEAHRAALEGYSRQRTPFQWAMTQNNLGTALQELGKRENGTMRHKEAVEAYHAALEERTRARVPVQWAMTQNNLGTALQELGEKESGTERLEQAVEAYHSALEEYTRESAPLEWAGTQNNLGNALLVLGEREGSKERFAQAAEAFHAALKERTCKRVPLQWAMTQNNLGAVLEALVEHEPGTERLEQAGHAYRAAFDLFAAVEASFYRDIAKRNLDRVLEILRERDAGS